MAQIAIKELQQSDIKAFIHLLQEQMKNELWETASEKNLEKRICLCLQATEAKQISPLLAIDDTTVIGYITLQWIRGLWSDFPEAFISDFYVGHIYRKKGVGTLLLEVAVREAKKRSCVRIFLENNQKNPVYKRGFYSKRGWREKENIVIFEFPIQQSVKPLTKN